MKEFYLKPKFFSDIKNYSKGQAVKDITAGIIVAIIALPLSIALAIASGVNPEYGIYTAIAAGFVVSLLGGSSIQIAGPTAAFATIIAGIQAGSEGERTSILVYATVMAGIILIIMGIFKLGSLIRYIPHTITVGFTGGIAVTILIGQIKDFAGIDYTGIVDKTPIEALEKIEANIHAAGTVSYQAVLVGVICLAILILYPRFEKRVPPSLIAVVAGILMVRFIPGLDAGVTTIGEFRAIPAGLPSLGLSDVEFSKDILISAIPHAFIIAGLAGVESLLSCVVADSMVDSRHNSNAELVAQGLGNIASAMFCGIPATGAIARTAANAKNGGRTPVAGMVHAITLLLVILFLLPLAELIPMPCIAAILFMVAYNMSEWRKFVKIYKTRKVTDIIVLTITFALTVIFDLIVAIGVGLGLALVFYIFNRFILKKEGAWA